MKKFLALLLALLLTLALVACANNSTNQPDSGKDSGKTSDGSKSDGSKSDDSKTDDAASTEVTLGISADPGTLAPFASRSGGRVATLIYVYENLVEKNAEADDGFIGVLAESWELLDPYTATITIHDNIYDIAGNHMTASDVAFSYATSAASGNNQKTASLDSVTAIDEYTAEFKFTTEVKVGDLLAYWTEIPCICQAAYEASDNEMATKPVGTGPYVLSDWTEGSSLTFVKNDDYWQTDVAARANCQKQNVDVVHMEIIQDTTQKALALQSGTIDIASGISPVDLPDFENNDAYALYGVTSGTINAMWFNCSDSSPCSNYNLRMAIALSFDSEEILKRANEGRGVVVYGYGNPKCIDYYGDDYNDGDYFNYNPDLAKEYLDKYYEETGTSSVTVKMIGQSSMSGAGTESEMMINYLNAVGIDVDLELLEDAIYNEKRYDPSAYDVCIGGGGCDTYLVSSLWDRDFNCNSTTTGTQLTFIKDDTLQKLLETAGSINTFSKENVMAIQNYVDEQCYCVGIFVAQNTGVHVNWIKSIALDSINQLMAGAFEYDWSAK